MTHPAHSTYTSSLWVPHRTPAMLAAGSITRRVRIQCVERMVLTLWMRILILVFSYGSTSRVESAAPDPSYVGGGQAVDVDVDRVPAGQLGRGCVVPVAARLTCTQTPSRRAHRKSKSEMARTSIARGGWRAMQQNAEQRARW